MITICSTDYPTGMPRYSSFEEMNLMNWIYSINCSVISFVLTKVTINATVYISFAYGIFGIQCILINFTARSMLDKNIIMRSSLSLYIFPLYFLYTDRIRENERKWKRIVVNYQRKNNLRKRQLFSFRRNT